MCILNLKVHGFILCRDVKRLTTILLLLFTEYSFDNSIHKES